MSNWVLLFFLESVNNNTGGLPTVHPASLSVGDDGVLAGCSLSGFRQAAVARPVDPKPGWDLRLNKLFLVNIC